MSLKVNKSTTLNGESKVKDMLVMTFNADISSESVGNTFVRQTIVNQELYNANRRECRKDISDFQDRVFEIEDQFIQEGTEEPLKVTEKQELVSKEIQTDNALEKEKEKIIEK